ncbi:DUF892 family protein [Echinicola jeungdonensis]|uniref:DUF892 family protein n=1 Tax=Echinicola jeungdonensis TaxID=709343 RepID=UPI0025B323D9|nr:DUF892 family protein [Echinicola jeungdonensis]MDN3671261.1 DUF892 family protein [Echinicola jeungdonensis]
MDQLKMETNGDADQQGQLIWKKSRRLMDYCNDPSLRDVVLINTLQKFIRHKINLLGTLSSYAIELDSSKWASILHKQLEDIKSLDNQFSELAEREINKKSHRNFTLTFFGGL